jgi:hypothetical protein
MGLPDVNGVTGVAGVSFEFKEGKRMKKLFVVLVMLLLLIPMAVSAQDQVTVSAQDQAFKPWWVTVSADVDTPVLGWLKNESTSDNPGGMPGFFPNVADRLETGAWKNVTFVGFGFALSGGYTPWQISPTIYFGFMGKATVAYTRADAGSIDWGMGLHSDFNYDGWWLGVSPMAAFRFQLGQNSYINLGAGISFWNYTSMTAHEADPWGNFDINWITDWADRFNVSSKTSGIGPAVYASINWGWATLEAGLTGPDAFVGFGATF